MNALSELTATEWSHRVLDAFPAGSYALTGLLRLMDIVASTDVQTAAVECVAEPRLFINPDFVERHAATPERLLMLVMHELHHVLLGHTTLFPRISAIDNFVFDAIINGIICRMFSESEYTSLLTDFYSDEEFPACLLRPSRGWPQRVDSELPALERLDEPLRSEVAALHRSLYSETGASYHEVYEVLPKVLSSMTLESLDPVPLLGGHDSEGPSGDSMRAASPLMFEIIRGLVEQWPQPPDPIRGRSLADVINPSQVIANPVAENRKRLRELIRRVAQPRGRVAIHKKAPTKASVVMPLPSRDRRSVVMRSLGFEPLLQTHEITATTQRGSIRPTTMYIDVSGSMEAVIPSAYGAVVDCLHFLEPTICLFSTKVAEVSLYELKSGVCRSTGGTDISCVVDHIRKHRVEQAVIITDGWVGALSPSQRDTLCAMHLGIAYQGANHQRLDLKTAAAHETTLVEVG
ncbi:MAG: hypothetical protein EBV34_14175 [Betaproteobacteria bacterium]|nr:hypothetical protein [Betaproteobacteria bacterium]